ncbi:MAG TPA: DUF4249 domain-containing protein [Chryseosolibacter sp.]
MNMNKYFILFAIFFLYSCELVVDVDIPIEKNQIVVNSFFTPDSVWKAKVSLSRHILDQADYRYITNANVVIYDGEIPFDTLQHDSLGYYRSNKSGPQPSQSYTIRVNAPGYSIAESSSSCPTAVAAEFSEPQVTVGEFQETLHNFSITFTDPPGKNFYQVMAIAEYRYTNPQTGQGYVNRFNPYIYSDDPGIDAEEIENSEGFFFPDALFNEEQFTINVKMSTHNWWGATTPTKYRIYFRSLSEDYYRYKTSSALQNYASGDPFAQPVKVYSNIQNGFGVFAGYSQTSFAYEK